jgi:hypothetical protein
MLLSVFLVPPAALTTWEQYYDEPWPALHYTGVTVQFESEEACEEAEWQINVMMSPDHAHQARGFYAPTSRRVWAACSAFNPGAETYGPTKGGGTSD